MSRTCILLFAVFATVTLVNAQVATTVSGTVVDVTLAVVPQAKVSLRLPGSETDLYVATTTSSGGYTLPNVNPGTYDLAVNAEGFQKKVVYQGLLVSPGRTTDVPPIQIEVAAIEQTVYVQAAEGAQTSTAEVSSSLTRMQIENMPVFNRNPMMPVLTLAGVNINLGGMMIVNGNRPAYPNVTLDGISLLNNNNRSNPIDPLLLDQVAAVTVSSSNQSSAAYGGSSQVTFVTPSGTNDYHGKLYFWNRASALAANTWFNNQAGIAKPFFNSNQMGGSVGGKILPNKLFFYTAYEAVRDRAQTSQNSTVLTADARNGIFTYQPGGIVRKVDILQAAGVQPDSLTQTLLAKVPAPDKINNFDRGDSSAALLLNTAGYLFRKRNNGFRDYLTAKIDYALSSRQSFSVTGLWNHDIADVPASDTTFAAVPSVQRDTTSKLVSSSWRWSPRANLTNEARFGFYLAPLMNRASQDIPNFFVANTVYTNPVNTFRTQGNNAGSYNFADNASYLLGAHSIQFGFHHQRVRVETLSDAGITPTYTLGIGGNQGLTSAQLPGATGNEINAANALLATLTGYYSGYSQTFNVTSPTSGYVNGASNFRHYTDDNYAFYIQDTWKVSRRLTANIGVRWDYLTPVDERDSIRLFPVLENNDPIQTLLGNATLDFAGKSVERPWYNADKNNFAPKVGLAWDVLGSGKTLLRAGYSISFVNDNVVFTTATGFPNSLFSPTATASGLSGRVGAGVVPIPTPVYKIPTTFADRFAMSTTFNPILINPNLVTPYVQQWNIALQQTIKGVVVEVRYVGNHGTKQIRGIDLNQVLIDEILPDFLKAQSNGFLSQKATDSFDPRFNPNIAGSQPLPYFDRLPGQGNLNNSTNSPLIMTGQVGELASTYQATRSNGPVNFYRNPLAQQINFVTNLGDTTYNGLQVEATYRFLRGLQVQANYTYSKALTDNWAGVGAFLNNLDPFLDNNNTKIERNRQSFLDLTHVFKATASYDLPLGRLPWSHPVARRVLEGWNIAGIFSAQSGPPFSITSGSRGTLNRQGRSGKNTANTTLNKAQLDDLIQFRMTPTGPYFIAASAIGPDGRGVAADGAAPFAGQVFFNPAAGTVGTLQQGWFSGPSIWTLDTKISKTTPIGERQSVELRLDASNVLNHPNFFIPVQSINSTTFGKITAGSAGLSTLRRQLQLSLSYRF